MASHESLPDGQRAILQLLLKQGKSYDDLAGLLKSDPTDIRARAHAAVSALGPDDPAVGPVRRREIADYLLGQQTASQRAATREYLEESGPGRAWARTAAGALRPLGGTLPEVPAEPAEVEQAFEALDRRAERQQEVARSSRRGGWLLVFGLGILLAVGLIAILGGFDGGSDKSGDGASTTSGPSTTATTPAQPLLMVAEMTPPKGGRKGAAGVAGIGVEGNPATLTVGLTARGLQPSPSSGAAYGMWLYNSRSQSVFIGFTRPLVKADGKLNTLLGLGKDGADLRAAVGRFKLLLLTVERSKKPKRPGSIVLAGALRPISDAGPGGTSTTTAPPATTTPSTTTTTGG